MTRKFGRLAGSAGNPLGASAIAAASAANHEKQFFMPTSCRRIIPKGGDYGSLPRRQAYDPTTSGSRLLGKLLATSLNEHLHLGERQAVFPAAAEAVRAVR